MRSSERSFFTPSYMRRTASTSETPSRCLLEMSYAEQQRLRIYNFITSRSTKRSSRVRSVPAAKTCLFLLDYPFVGLGSRESAVCLDCLRPYMAAGHSFVISDNRSKVLRTCDMVYRTSCEVDSRPGRVYNIESPSRRGVLNRL